MPNIQISPLKAIRAKCLECSSGSNAEVRLCPINKCPLYMYRFGHKPKLEKRINKIINTL